MIPVSLRYRHFDGMECAPTRVTRCKNLSLESKPTGLVFTNEAKSLGQPTYSESSKGERGLPYAHQPPSPVCVHSDYVQESTLSIPSPSSECQSRPVIVIVVNNAVVQSQKARARGAGYGALHSLFDASTARTRHSQPKHKSHAAPSHAAPSHLPRLLPHPTRRPLPPTTTSPTLTPRKRHPSHRHQSWELGPQRRRL